MEIRSKTAKRSRRKGKRGERKLIPILETWWGTKFRRTPGSGGLRWGTDSRVAGDLVTNDPAFPWVIEEKNQEKWDLHQIFQEKGPIFDWFHQAAQAGKRVGKLPILFFTKNYQPYFIMIRRRDLLKHQNQFLVPKTVLRVKRNKTTYLIATTDELLPSK
ncbi:MAG: Resolvase [Candidatus Gottesmanbacteria bacterium GW2011_GWB1_49_7]|uniref:Resolvase n=1 Tax=Candidatus Gottesmanbacteria bacterium GW2011_GWB1_49_7 TaxID=1618448 RepID=A0A0G1VW98_9BACT|nr:MAG: Resolvase [Candidatus Gottesmanbacteria bacterium GW2011_GWB1_49_7]